MCLLLYSVLLTGSLQTTRTDVRSVGRTAQSAVVLVCGCERACDPSYLWMRQARERNVSGAFISFLFSSSLPLPRLLTIENEEE